MKPVNVSARTFSITRATTLPLRRTAPITAVLTGQNATTALYARPLIVVAVLALAADEGLIDFNNATELFDILNQRGSDLVAHEPRGFVRAEAHEAHDLQCAHAFLAGEHEMHDAIPVAKRLVRVLKDRPRNVRE